MKIKTLTLLTIFVFCMNVDFAHAEKTPRNGAADNRIKTFTYSENDVYRLRGHYGYSTVIELSSKETIESVSIGDSEAWQIVRAGRPNILFIKPILDNAHTNMTLITNKRMYTFDLSAKKAASHHSHDLAFRVKFIYSNESDASLAHFKVSSKASYNPFEGVEADSFNFDYSYSGSKRLRPTKAFDDGVFTYMSFPKFETMPAVFEVKEDGSESLVNFTTKGKYLVVSSIGKQFTLRDGDTATCIFNDTYPKRTGKEHKVVPISELSEKLVKDTSEEDKIVLAMNTPLPKKKPTTRNKFNFKFPKLSNVFGKISNPVKKTKSTHNLKLNN